MTDAVARDMTEHIRSRLVGVNIPPGERLATAFVGGLALGAGLRRRSLGGLALAGLGSMVLARAISGRCPLYRARAIRKGVQVRRSVTIQASPRAIYDLWRDLPNLPKFLSHVKRVTVDPDGTSTWMVDAGATTLAWRAEIVEDSPGHRLRWRSLPGGDIRHNGSIELRQAAADRGTIVEVKLHYFPPGGLFVASALNGFLRKLTSTQLAIELARLQQLVETGEIATGARRVDAVPEDDRAIAIEPAPSATRPVMTAQTSSWLERGPR